MDKNESASKSTYTLRLRCRYDYQENKIHVIATRRVKMIPPPSDSTEHKAAESGFWYELRDKDGRSLYRRILHSPLEPEVEVLADEEHHLMKKSRQRAKIEFTLVVSDIAEAHTLVIMSSPVSPTEKREQPAKELAHFNLKELKKHKEVRSA